MSDVIKTLHDELESTITSLFPEKKSSPYQFDISKNANKQSVNIYAIRPGSFRNLPYTNRVVSCEQFYKVEFARSYNNKPGSDEDLKSKIFDLSKDITVLANAGLRSKFGIARVLLASDFSASEPNINEDNNVVSIVLEFTIKYKLED